MSNIADLSNGLENSSARALAKICLEKYVAAAVFDPPKEMEQEIAILLTLCKNFADKPAIDVINQVKGMPKIMGMLAGKVFIEVLEERILR